MLTRLEVSGFKNLLDLEVDFGPYTCIAGQNGVGKSNLFDAITFLAALADLTFMDAARKVRSESRRGVDVRDLFWDPGPEWRHPGDPMVTRSMRFGVEMIVPAEVVDDFARKARASITFLRYELELGYVPADESARFGQIKLLHESLKHITVGEASRHLHFPHRAAEFRNRVVVGRRTGAWLISTSRDDGELTIRVHQDGGSRGQPKPSAARHTQRTIVATTTTIADPTILAARREMQGWRLLALEPAAMREPSEISDPMRMATSGAHLAATLYRLAHPRISDVTPAGLLLSEEEVYADIAARLSQLVGVRSLRVDRDDARELLTLVAEEGGARLSARSLSDGTLRFLALCVLAADPEATGLVCMEEPENGIHPARLHAMAELVRSLAVNSMRAPGPENPFRQVIVNTHSPGFVRLQADDDLLVATRVAVRRGDDQVAHTVTLFPCTGTWRERAGAAGLPRAVVENLLADDTRQLPLVAADSAG